MNPKEAKIINRFKSILQERIRLHQLILFGSRARGDAASDSDMDVLVILDEPKTTQVRDVISDCAWEAGFEDGIIVSPVVVSREEWEQGAARASLLAMAVREEGTRI